MNAPWSILLLISAIATAGDAKVTRSPQTTDATVRAAMSKSGARGMSIAVIEHGHVRYVQAYGVQNKAGDPLRTDTVMYGASLTKTVSAYHVLRLVDQGKLALDTPLSDYLAKRLIEYDTDAIFPGKYGPYRVLAGDDRWSRITARHSLTHSTGFANF